LAEIRNEPMVAPALDVVRYRTYRPVLAWAGAVVTIAVAALLTTYALRQPALSRQNVVPEVATTLSDENERLDESYLVIVASEQGADPNRALILVSRNQGGKPR
jgi:hypothetical protein